MVVFDLPRPRFFPSHDCRRGLADALRAVARPNDRILPVSIQDRVARMDRHSSGINRVAVALDDGTEQHGVRVAWATEVVGVDGHDRIPFAVARITDVRPDLAPEEQQDDSAPF